MPQPLIIVDNYDSFTYNLFQMVQAVSPLPVQVFRNDAIALTPLLALKPAGIILSPGPGHPANPKDFGVCREVLIHQAKFSCPILGVCLGHQGMGHHFGGQVTPAPAIFHGKTSQITLTNPCPLFKGISSPTLVMRYHSWMVDAASLPEDFIITAVEPVSGVVMAMRHRSLPLFGVQFHPESIGTPEGAKLLTNFVELCRQHLSTLRPAPASDDPLPCDKMMTAPHP